MKSGTTRRPFSAASRQGDEFADDGPETQYSMQQVVQWSEGRVGQWLRKQGFARHERAFMENQINGEALLELDYNLLKELSVRTVGERVRLNIAIRDLRNKCLQGDAIASARPDTSRSKARGLPSLQIINEPHTSGVSTLVGTQQMPPPPMIRGPSKELPNIPTGSPGTAQTASTLGGSNSTATSSVIRSPGLREIGAPPPTFPFGLTEPGSIKGPGNLRYRKMTAIPASQSPATKPATLDPNSPESRLRALFGGHLHSPGPPSQMNQVDTDAQEQLEEVERLNMQFQELFGTDIGVTNLADSLSLKVRQVAITGPDHVVRHISVSSTRSAHEILARILREFDLDRDVDKDRYALFVMSTDGGGARSLTDSEIVEIFNDPDSLVREKIFLRKRHQLAKPTPGARRSEQLQKAFEKLGNILPRQSSHNTISSLSAHSQTSASSSTLLGSTQMANEAGSSSMQPALSPQPTGPQPLGQSVVSLAQMQQGQTKPQNPSSIDKLQRMLGDRPPSEQVSMNVEKYFPGNEARARHSIMRKHRRESHDSMMMGQNSGILAKANNSRRSTISSRNHHRRNSSGSRGMHARLASYSIAGGSSQVSAKGLKDIDTKLEAIGEQAETKEEEAETGTKAKAKAEAQTGEKEAADTKLPAQGVVLRSQSLMTPKTNNSFRKSSLSRKNTITLETTDEHMNKRLSRIYIDPSVNMRVGEGESEFVDDDDDASDGNVSTEFSSDFSDSMYSGGSFDDSFDESDSSFLDAIDEDQEESDDSRSAPKVVLLSTGQAQLLDLGNGSASASTPAVAGGSGGPASDATKVAQQDKSAVSSAGGSHSASTGGNGASAVERRSSVARSEKAVRAKKKSWIKGAPIASGSFGSVYFAMNTKTGIIMAVKEVELPTPGSASLGRKQRMVDALQHELALLQDLDHKNVVQYLGTDHDDQMMYIFLEYVPGGSVASALASYGTFPEPLIQAYTAQILEGLVYLHEQGIIHRDIKGGNVLIDQNGSVKISDFGISKRVDEAAATNKLGNRASLQGSVFWMAPEVVKNTHYTYKGDIWSLGCLVIEMMTGRHPFPELDQMQALLTIGQMGRPKIPGGISAEALSFLEATLELDVAKRPGAQELRSHPFVRDIQPSTP